MKKKKLLMTLDFTDGHHTRLTINRDEILADSSQLTRHETRGIVGHQPHE